MQQAEKRARAEGERAARGLLAEEELQRLDVEQDEQQPGLYVVRCPACRARVTAASLAPAWRALQATSAEAWCGDGGGGDYRRQLSTAEAAALAELQRRHAAIHARQKAAGATVKERGYRTTEQLERERAAVRQQEEAQQQRRRQQRQQHGLLADAAEGSGRGGRSQREGSRGSSRSGQDGRRYDGRGEGRSSCGHGGGDSRPPSGAGSGSSGDPLAAPVQGVAPPSAGTRQQPPLQQPRQQQPRQQHKGKPPKVQPADNVLGGRSRLLTAAMAAAVGVEPSSSGAQPKPGSAPSKAPTAGLKQANGERSRGTRGGHWHGQ